MYGYLYKCMSCRILTTDFGVDKIVKLSQETNFPWLLSNVFDNLNNRPLAEGKTSHMIEWNGKKVSFLSNDVTRPHFVNS